MLRLNKTPLNRGTADIPLLSLSHEKDTTHFTSPFKWWFVISEHLLLFTQAGNTQAFVEQYLRAIRLQQQTTAPVAAPRTHVGGVLPRDGK